MLPQLEDECIIDSEDEGADAVRDMDFCCNCRRYDYDSKLSHDLLNNRCYWSGAILCDYVFHVVNCHPLLGCYCSHPAHPYGKHERISVLVIVSALTLFASAAMTTTLTQGVALTNEAVVTSPPSAGVIVATAENDSEFWRYVQDFFSTKSWLILLFCVTIPVMILQFILEKLCVIDIYFMDYSHRMYIGSCCQCIVQVIRAVKSCCLCCSCLLAAVVSSLSFLVLQYAANEEDGVQGVEVEPEKPWQATLLPLMPLAISRMQSWVLWFPLDLFMPCCGFLHKWISESSRAVDVNEYDQVDIY